MHKPLILIGSFLLLFNIIETTSIAKCSRNDRKSIELETTSGKLLGQCDFVKVNDNNPRAVKSGNVYSWLGVPYAEPPINQYRFKSPVEVRTRSDPIDATKWPNSCVPLLDTSSQYQVPIFNGYKMWFEPTNTSEYSEDCLYLNIWLPAEAYLKTNVFNYNLEPTKSPIMVFFHGGGTIRGSTSIDVYNPATFVAATNTIVITVNYRLGLFGNFYLDGEFPGNQALLDQNEALRWVRNNADAMGGDPNKITIYGHSSGAAHVGYHLFFKDSWQLFNNAILQSGTPLLRPLAAISREEANLRSREILNLIGCLNDTSSGSDAAMCAQNALHINKAAVDYNKKLSNSNRFVGLNILTPFVPVIDGRVLKDSPENLLARGEYKRCPVMIGYLIDEGSMFAGYSAQSPSEESIRKRPSLSHKQLKATLKDLFTYYPRYPHQSNHLIVDAILHEYTKIIDSSEQPKSALIKPNYFHILSKIIGDAFFVCPAYKMIDLLASNSPKNLYLYLFAHRISSTPWPSWYGATHGDELAFTFAHTISERDEKTINGENPWANPRHRYSSGEKLLTNEMITYWSSFAKTDSPNSKNLVHWPEYTLFKGDFQSDNMSDVSESVRYIIFKSTGIRVNRGYSLEICQFWNYYIDHLIEENDNQVKSRKCDVSTTNNRQIERPSALKERAYNDKNSNTNLNNNSQRIEISRFFLLFFVSALYFVLF